MNLKNMKFKVSSPEQSERLQKVLFGLGYNYQWGHYHGIPQWLNDKCLYTGECGAMYSDLTTTDPLYEVTDTESFIALHTDKPFEGLEEAYNEPKSVGGSPWFVNDGTMPDLPKGTCIDVVFLDESAYTGDVVDFWEEEFASVYHDGKYDIVKWRYTNAKDYFKQPRTAGGAEGRNEVNDYKQPKTTKDVMSMKLAPNWPDTIGAEDFMKEPPKETPVEIDAHYNFSYTLSQDDVDAGYIKIDPYFVSQQWNLGSKDSTGVIFHCLKTLSRYGDKNTKEREIIALHKQIVRLAQLEGVSLETRKP